MPLYDIQSMKTRDQLLEILTSLISGWEGECVEFKEAGDGFSTSDIDYTQRERILVIERQSELVFQNAGNFFDGAPREYVLHNRTPTRYRNRFLAEAMLQLRMIDTMGFGIREIDEEMVTSLRNQKLVEGRRPHLRVAWHIAASTDDQVDYIHRKAFDDEYYRDIILEYSKVFGSAPRAKLQQLVEEKRSKSLTPKQKYTKVTPLLRTLSESGKVMAHGATKAAIWKLNP